MVRDVAFRLAPRSVVAVIVVVFTLARPTMFVSPAAAVTSLIADVSIYGIGLLLYLRSLRSLRRNPGAHPQMVLCYERDRDDPVLLALFGWFLPSTIIAPGEFVRYLDADLRLLDTAHLRRAALKRTTKQAMASGRLHPSDCDAFVRALKEDDLPHLVEWTKAEQAAPRYRLRLTKLSRVTRSSLFQTNRFLNAGLTEDDWTTSIALLQRMPRAIATCWKTFHMQESARLRLVSFFNTVDLVQRLCTIAVLADLRAEGGLERAGSPFSFAKSSFGEWNRLLSEALRAPSSPASTLRRVLLEERQDWDALVELTKRLRSRGVEVPEGRSTLAGLRLLGDIRNVVLGHGVLERSIRLSPRDYLASAHQFFLALVRDIVRLDFGIAAIFDMTIEGVRVTSQVGVDRGIDANLETDSRCLPFVALDGRWLPLWPYCVFADDRLLFLNRTRSDGAEYIDFAAAAIEPSFRALSVPLDAFAATRPPADERIVAKLAGPKPCAREFAIWDAADTESDAGRWPESLALYRELERLTLEGRSPVTTYSAQMRASALAGQAFACYRLGRRAEAADIRSAEWRAWLEAEDPMEAVAALLQEAALRRMLGESASTASILVRATEMLAIFEPGNDREREAQQKNIGKLKRLGGGVIGYR
jgi:hypothetical protein